MKTFPLSRLMEASDTQSGFCLDCGAEAEQPCEPDAREYECSACGQKKVYGAEELILMGAVSDEEEG